MQKVNKKRKAATSFIVLILVVCLLLFTMFIYCMNSQMMVKQGAIIKDSMTTSNLATLKNIDLNTLGSDLKTTVILDTVSKRF